MRRENTRASVGRAARRALWARGGKITWIMLSQVLLRLPALLMLVLFIRQLPFFFLPAWGWLIPWTLMNLFLVLPLRFWAGSALRACAAPGLPPERHFPYGAFFRCALMRYARGLLWGLPFLAGAGLFLYGMEYLPFNTMGGYIQRFAALLGVEPTLDRGLIVVFALLLLLAAGFALGWRRDMPMEYLPAGRLGARGVCRCARKVRFRGRGMLARNTLVNFLLSLPALMGGLAVLLPYAAGNLRVTGNKLMLLQSVMRLLKAPLPGKELLMLALVFLLLYLPLCALRKTRNAALVRRLSREWDAQGGGHAAG